MTKLQAKEEVRASAQKYKAPGCSGNQFKLQSLDHRDTTSNQRTHYKNSVVFRSMKEQQRGFAITSALKLGPRIDDDDYTAAVFVNPRPPYYIIVF